MRVWMRAFKIAVAGITATVFYSPAPSTAALPAPSIEGLWQGPFVGRTFTFEFKQVGNGWTGRYQSDKSHKWFDLHDITVTDGILRFNFVSQPPSNFTFNIDAAGGVLNGSATFGQHPPLPLMLTRVLAVD